MNVAIAKRFTKPVRAKTLLWVWVGICLFFAWESWPLFCAQSGDYGLYYSIGELFSAGQPKDIYVTWEQGPWYGYPAIVAPIFHVLQWIPLPYSRQLFFGLKILLLCTWPFLLVQCSANDKNRVRSYFFAGLATMIVFPAIFEEVLAANINTFLLTLAFASFALTRYGYITFSAAAITFIASFKPQYSLFFIPCLLLSPKKSIAGGIISLSTLALISISQYGFQGFLDLMKRWSELMATPLAMPNDVNNMSTSGFFVRMLSPLHLDQSGSFQGVNVFSLSFADATLVGRVVSGILSISMLYTMYRGWQLRPKEKLLEFYTGICLITLLVTPVIWLTHYMFLVLPIFGLTQILSRQQMKSTIGVLLVLGTTLFFASQMFHNPGTTAVVTRAYGLPYCALMSASLLFILGRRTSNDA